MSGLDKTPVEMLTGLLAEMTARVMEAESAAAKARRDADDWYASYMSASKKNTDLQTRLDAEMELHAQTREKLADAEKGLDEEIAAHSRHRKRLMEYIEKYGAEVTEDAE